MKSAVIVQARFASTRLRGKVLLPLAGHTVLWHVMERCHKIAGADVVVCAVPDGEINDPVAEEAKRCGAVVTRGSESDVLDRYNKAAIAVGADVVMRVTSDCPLIEPAVCAQVLALVRAGVADYACNNMPRSFPHGLDCEAFTAKWLAEAARVATAPDEREHVTPWLRNNASLRRVNLYGPGGEAALQRITLDTPEDYDVIRAIMEAA
jgi:spore coat polysaccharide biosynthesis protein SpsF